MRRGKDISWEYYDADKAARFDYLYDHYKNRERLLECKKSCVAYMIEGQLMRSDWDKYCLHYFGRKRLSTVSMVKEWLEKGDITDLFPNGIDLPEDIQRFYKSYCLMKLEFNIFCDMLKTIGGEDERLLQRYISEEITLWDIADERRISYETAKGKIRDLKKTLKERTIVFFTDVDMTVKKCG